MTSPFDAQRRMDDFRRGLGNLGGRVERHQAVDQLLDTADRYGWTAFRLGQYVAHQLRNHEHPGPGLVLRVAADVGAAPEPLAPSQHQQDARARATRSTFRQPKAACGRCDGSPGRWLDVTPADHPGAPVVIHCPSCWVEPPGYVPPSERPRPYRL